MILKSLQNIGFSEKEARVIDALSKLPKEKGFPSTVAKAAGLNRYSVYDILERLNEQSLILKLKRNGKLCYELGGLENIESWLQRKLKEAQQQIKIAESSIIPELREQLKVRGGKPDIQYYEGRVGIYTIAKEVERLENVEIYYLSSARTVLNSFNIEVVRRHEAKKKKRKVFSKLIFPLNEKNVVLNFLRESYEKSGNDLYECRLFDFKTITNEVAIFSDRISITNIDSLHPFALLIYSQEVYQSYFELFQGIWKKAKKI